MRASYNSQLQLQARSTRTCLSCLAPFGKFNYSKSHANELDGKVKQQTGRGKEKERERKETRLRIKLRSGFPISKLHIAYVFCCLICAGIVCFLQHKLTILSPSHTHYLPIYALPSFSLSPSGITHFTWRYSASLANSIYVSNLIFCQQLENTKIFSPTRTVRSSS